MDEDKRLDDLLSKVDADKRDFLKKMVIGTAFAIPVILSFGMDNVKARAQQSKSLPPASPIG
jgi:hypothetical protein